MARVELVDHEGPLALVAVDDPAFWEGLEPLPLAERAPGEGDVTILRWQRSGLLDAFPGTMRQVRSGRHGLSQTSLLTLEIGSSTDGLGESEVVIAKGRVAGLVTGRDRRRATAPSPPPSWRSSSKGRRRATGAASRAPVSPGRTSRTRPCASGWACGRARPASA